MFIGALVKMLPAAKAAVMDDDVDYYGQLIHGVFKPGNLPVEKAPIIVFASASKEAGTSFITREIGLELARYGKGRIAIIDARRLQSISKSDLEMWAKLCATAESGVSWLKTEAEVPVNNKPSSRKKASSWH